MTLPNSSRAKATPEQVDSQDGFHRALQWRESSRVDDVGEPATRTREIRQLSNGTPRRDVDPPGDDVVTVDH